MTTIEVPCLQRDKSSGQCERATLFVERLPNGTIRDAESGDAFPKAISHETILGWGEMDGTSHIVLDGACHEYLVPTDSAVAKWL